MPRALLSAALVAAVGGSVGQTKFGFGASVGLGELAMGAGVAPGIDGLGEGLGVGSAVGFDVTVAVGEGVG